MITLCRSPEIERLLSSREFSLLARCSVWPLKEEQVYAIQKAAAPPIEWGHFMALVHRHRVAGLVHENIGHAGISLPPDTRSKIAALARMIASENIGLIAESNRLQKSFRDADVEFLFLKGVSLARLAYTNVGVRHIRDIDILVTPSKIELAHLVLSKAGYNPYQPPSAFSPAQRDTWLVRTKDLSYVHPQSKQTVELHTRLFDNRHLMPFDDFEAAITDPARTMGLRSLPEDLLFSYLCLHGSAHCWFRLKWLADLGALLSQQPTGGIERLYAAAKKQGAGPAASQALLLLDQVLRASIPKHLIASACSNRRTRVLNKIAVAELSSDVEPGESISSIVRRMIALLFLGSGLRYWLNELRNSLVSPIDVLHFPPPKPLWPVYPIFSVPLRLLRLAKRANIAVVLRRVAKQTTILHSRIRE